MDKKNKLFWVLFISTILVLISIITLNYDQINYFIEKNVGVYGYPAVFAFSFLCDIIDQPIIPEAPGVVGVIYGLDILKVFLFGAAGISLVGIINFNIGKRFFKKRLESLCKTKKYANYCRLFYKYGNFALLFAALTPSPYVTFVWLSGAFDMRFRTFFVFGMLGKALRLGVVLLAAVIVL